MFRHGVVSGIRCDGLHDFTDRAGVNIGVLPHVEARQMKPETVNRAAQAAQTPLCERIRLVGGQGAVDDIEIGQQRRRIIIRLKPAYPGISPTRRCPVKRLQRSVQSRDNHGNGASIGLDIAMGRSIGRAVRKGCERVRHIDHPRGQGQFIAKFVQLIHVECKRLPALHLQRALHDPAGDERVSVAITADPAADA